MLSMLTFINQCKVEIPQSTSLPYTNQLIPILYSPLLQNRVFGNADKKRLFYVLYLAGTVVANSVYILNSVL